MLPSCNPSWFLKTFWRRMTGTSTSSEAAPQNLSTSRPTTPSSGGSGISTWLTGPTGCCQAQRRWSRNSNLLQLLSTTSFSWAVLSWQTRPRSVMSSVRYRWQNTDISCRIKTAHGYMTHKSCLLRYRSTRWLLRTKVLDYGKAPLTSSCLKGG